LVFLRELGEVWWPAFFAAVGVVFEGVAEYWAEGDLGGAAEEGGEEGCCHDFVYTVIGDDAVNEVNALEVSLAYI
jgi:hypothetical protein